MTQIFSIMTQNDAEDEDDDVEEDDDTPALAASQALDTLALNLPPEKYISALLSQVSYYIISFHIFKRLYSKGYFRLLLTTLSDQG